MATDFGGAIYNESHGGSVNRSDFCGNLPTHIHGRYSDGGANSFADTCLGTECASIQGVIQVPSAVATIAQAITCAVDGDVIEVGPGFYSEAIDFQGKRITIEATHGPTATYLDGSGLSGTSLVTFRSGESSESILRGFTLFGSAAGTVDGDTNQFVGGAIYVYGASPTIEECIIAHNSSGIGGGGYLRYSEATIRNCLIRGNSAVNGGGLAIVDSDTVLQDVEFIGNEATNFGGGLGVGMTGQAPGNVLLDGCVMRWNSAGASGGGIAVSLQQSQFGVILMETTVCSNESNSIHGEWFDQGGNTVCGCMADITGDGAVDGADLAQLLGGWGPNDDPVESLGDFDGDGLINGADLAQLLGMWGNCQ